MNDTNGTNEFLDAILKLPTLNVTTIPGGSENPPELTPKETVPVMKVSEWIHEIEKPEEAIVEALIYKNTLNVLGGSPKAGKTTLAHQLAVCVSKGIPFLEHNTVQTPVLYLSLEEHESRVRRAFRTLGVAEDDELFLVFKKLKSSDYKLVIQGLREQIIDNNIGLVVIDTIIHMPKEGRLKDSSVLDYNNTVDWWNDYMDIAHELDVAVMLIYHMPKFASSRIGRSPINSMFGSTGLGAMVDQAYAVWREPNDKRSFQTEGRLPDFPDHEIILNEETLWSKLGAKVIATAEDKGQSNEGKIINALKDITSAWGEPYIPRGVLITGIPDEGEFYGVGKVDMRTEEVTPTIYRLKKSGLVEIHYRGKTGKKMFIELLDDYE